MCLSSRDSRYENPPHTLIGNGWRWRLGCFLAHTTTGPENQFRLHCGQPLNGALNLIKALGGAEHRRVELSGALNSDLTPNLKYTFEQL